MYKALTYLLLVFQNFGGKKVKEMILALLKESDLILPEDIIEFIIQKVQRFVLFWNVLSI